MTDPRFKPVMVAIQAVIVKDITKSVPFPFRSQALAAAPALAADCAVAALHAITTTT